jgi:nitrate reductase gamma subunit
MMGVLPLWCYLALAGFLLGSLYKAVRYATMPMHVRWELYPVAHEKGKAAYGGSYFEELDWWTKPRETSRLGEVKVMAEEVLTLKAVRENNRRLWLPSLAFHYGLYLLFGLAIALFLGAVARLLAVSRLEWLAGGRVLSVWGFVALASATIGAAALLWRRLGDRALRNASTPADFFHLVLLLAVFLASWGSWLTVDRYYTGAANLVLGLVGFEAPRAYPVWVNLEVGLLGLFLAYLPWSHMTHMFAKYFTWHSVRWDDAPNLGGEAFERRVQRLLMLPVHWSAPHIRGDGRKTWADVATEGGES